MGFEITDDMAYIFLWIMWNVGWEIFKLIGADLGLKRILQKKYLFHMLQKFALFFFVGLSLQFLMLASSMTSAERTLTIWYPVLLLLTHSLLTIALAYDLDFLILILPPSPPHSALPFSLGVV